VKVRYKDLISGFKSMTNNGICLNLARWHGKINAYALRLLIWLEGFYSFEDGRAWPGQYNPNKGER
jgi:hypothetical protein